GAAPVVDDDRLPELLAELLVDVPGRGVDASAGRPRDDEAHRTLGVGLRGCRGGSNERGGRKGESLEAHRALLASRGWRRRRLAGSSLRADAGGRRTIARVGHPNARGRGSVKRSWQVASVALLAVFAFFAFESLRLSLADALGPGPGFFPFWLSMIGGVLAAILLAQLQRGTAGGGEGPPAFVPAGAGDGVLVVAGVFSPAPPARP